jgi:hypothetical protein
MSMKNSIDTIGNRFRDVPVCSAVTSTSTNVKSLIEKIEANHQATETKVALRIVLQILDTMGTLNTRSSSIFTEAS